MVRIMTKGIAIKNLDEHFTGMMCCKKEWAFIRTYTMEARPTVRAKRPVQQLKAKIPRHTCNTCSAICSVKDKSSNMYCASWKRGPSAV